MPELPEVETVRRGLAPIMEGAELVDVKVNRPNLRFPFPHQFAEQLTGTQITHVGRRAKYLTVELSSGRTIIMHLGMSGSFRIELDDTTAMPGAFHHPRTEQKTHDHVVFNLEKDGANASVIYNDPRRFGFMDLVASEALNQCKHFSNMGIEPTGNRLDGEAVSQLFIGKTAPLKAALLDQSLIAGLGNIYVCEALWRAGLSPKRKAHTISRKDGSPTKRSEVLAGHIRDVIAEAIEAGGSSLRDHRQTNGELGYFQHSFKAYDQEGNPCLKTDCDGTIRRITQSGRSTFYCATCQR